MVATQPDVKGQRAGRDFTDADYIPVETYLKTGQALIRAQGAPLGLVSTVTATPAVGTGRTRAAIALYLSIFNYGNRPAPELSIHA